jgi:D-glycero-D-manno-heptose 1,7-bisphosphate phosphatase
MQSVQTNGLDRPPENRARTASAFAAQRSMTTNRVKAVFLDRDGVINATVMRRGAARAPADLDEWRWIEGVHETLRALHASRYLLIVCTNQPDVVRGWQTREQVEVFHRHIMNELPVARIYTCFHDAAEACACRKPKPGMLLAATTDFDVDLALSFMVGDRASDIEAGRAAGCRTIHLRHASDAQTPIGADHEIGELRELLGIIR